MDAQRILVATRGSPRLASHRRGTVKPVGAAVFEQNVVEAKHRRRAKTRSNLDVVISNDHQPWSASFRPHRAGLRA